MKVLLACFSALIAAGCTTLLPQNQSPRAAQELPAAISSLIDIQGEQPIIVIEDVDSRHQSMRIIRGDELLHFDYYRSSLNITSKHHLVFIYRILNDPNNVVARTLANVFLDAGYDCIIINQEAFLSDEWIRPVLPRRNKWIRPVLPRRNNHGLHSYDEYNAMLARGVGRIINYWLPQQVSLSGKYAFVGVSLGGIHAVGAAAIFPDAAVTIAVMAGGDNAEIFKKSEERIVILNREKLLEQYATRLAAENPTAKIDYTSALYNDIGSLNFQILQLARCIETNKIKLVITMRDKSVPTECQWNLYHALGGPETRLYPTGHYTLALYYFSLKEQLLKWLGNAFKEV